MLDPNVIVSGLLSRKGSPARILTAWDDGAFELAVSLALLEELRRVLAYPKLRSRIPQADAATALQWLSDNAEIVADPDGPPPARSPDPDDDYLLVLAAHHRIPLVSGDKYLLGLADRLPILTAAQFADLLAEH